MKILITGVCGLLGSHLAALLSQKHTVIGTDRHPWWGDFPLQVIQADLAEPAAADRLVHAAQPETLIHCAAMANVDACEKDPASALKANAGVTRDLIRVVAAGCRVVYISTDGLFQGDRPFVDEQTPPAPKTAYGRSKLEGEREVLKSGRPHLVVRTNFYGWSSGRKKTFGEWLYEGLRTRQPITLFEDFFFTPIYVADLAENLAVLLEGGHQGIFHLAGKDRLSKYQFGAQLAQEGGFSLEAVRVGSLDEADFLAARPRDMSLSSDRFVRETGTPLPQVRDGLVRFLRDRGRSLSRRFKKECLA